MRQRPILSKGDLLAGESNVARCRKHVGSRTSSLVKNRETFCCTGDKQVVGPSPFPVDRYQPVGPSDHLPCDEYYEWHHEHRLREPENICRESLHSQYECKLARDWHFRERLQFDFSVESSHEFVITHRPGTANAPVMKPRPGPKCTNENSARAHQFISSLPLCC